MSNVQLTYAANICNEFVINSFALAVLRLSDNLSCNLYATVVVNRLNRKFS